jgi:hypothetical protein
MQKPIIFGRGVSSGSLSSGGFWTVPVWVRRVLQRKRASGPGFLQRGQRLTINELNCGATLSREERRTHIRRGP